MEIKKEARETFKETLKLLDRHLSFRLHHNAVYDPEDHFRVLVHAAMSNTSLEASSVQLNVLSEAPSADAVQYHFEKKDAKVLEGELDFILKDNITAARKRRLFFIPRDVAIDFHKVPWYGKPEPWVVGGKHDRGTSYFVEFATLEVVEKGERLTLKAVPVTQFKNKEAIVEELLEFAQRLMKIRRLYIDRYFPGVEVIKVIEGAGVKWVASLTKYDKVKEIIVDAHRNGGFIREYVMGRKGNQVSFNLVILESKDYGNRDAKITAKYNTFATNLEVDEGKRGEIGEFYRKRWGIETGYRVKKEFKIHTSTRSYAMKVLFFFLSVVMYNLWVLFNLFYALARNMSIEKPAVTTGMLKFYYYWTLFRPEDFGSEGGDAKLYP